MKRIFSILLLVLLLVSAIAIPASAVASVPTHVLSATNSVVRVFSEYSDGWASGSGFVISTYPDATFIVTNYHVVEDNPTYIYIYDNEIDDLLDVSVFGCDPAKDLCILRLDRATKYKPLVLNVKAKKGDRIFAVGFPGAADFLSDDIAYTSADATVTDGIISAIRSLTITKGEGPITLYQISAAINHGNSGGPLLNDRGEVVGINTYGIEGAESVNGAIASSELLLLAESNGLVVNVHSFMWVIIFALLCVIVVIVVILIAVSRNKRKPKKSAAIPLRIYISDFHQRLSEEQAVSLLMPIAVELRKLHEDGRPHLQVSPDSIVISNGKAILTEPKSDESNRYTSGFAAPEVYKGKNCGQLTDIYSFCSVLVYAISGIIPENALSRIEADQNAENVTSEVDGILQKGRRLTASERYDSMRELILELSPYNTMATLPHIFDLQGHSAVANVFQKKSDKKKRTKKQSIRLGAAIAAGAILISVAAYGGSYLIALLLANKGEFSKANMFIWIPAVTKLHDPQLSKYVYAGQLFERKNYQAAKEAFDQCGDYRNSNELGIESNYQYGVALFDSGDYLRSIEVLENLVIQKYKDANDYLLESKYQYAQLCVENEDYEHAILLYSELSETQYKDADNMLLSTRIMSHISSIHAEKHVGSNYDKAAKLIKELREIDSGEAFRLTSHMNEATYKYACKKYNDENYSVARAIFEKIPDYKESGKYKLLCDLVNGNVGENSYKEIISSINFANTKLLLLANTRCAQKFLVGTWRTSSGGFYFSMQKNTNNTTNYNLPYLNLANSHYYIEDGVFTLRSGSLLDAFMGNYRNELTSSSDYAEKKVFKFTILSADSISVYCYKDGSTHILYRQ